MPAALSLACDRRLLPILERIGIPGPAPFVPDPFQLEALEALKANDVVVSAPTGAGKTWIATRTIEDHLAKGLKVWYASPLKALSNSLYQEFCHVFGVERCGILTGDRKENPEAPLIVGTTEILRNQLYDAMDLGMSLDADLVILDEAHYLGDEDRGVVWEEVMIYLPSRVRLLLLSATMANPEELCLWLQEIRGVPNRIVRSEVRPVPLEVLFLLPEGCLVPLAGKRGVDPRVRKAKEMRGRGRGPWTDYGELIHGLRALNLLPAIFFLKSRADCDRAVFSCRPSPHLQEKRGKLMEALQGFLETYPHLKGHRQLRPLQEAFVGSHHGGQLPTWKVLVEKMMNAGHLEAIFSTSTVAAGVNFPARTVVLVQSDRFNGREFLALTATELHQMMGRAGRRGKDHVGFVLVLPGIHQDPAHIQELRSSPPEALKSRIHVNFSMTLNLLLSQDPLEVKDLLQRSFALFQARRAFPAALERWEGALLDLETRLPHALCDLRDPEEVLFFLDSIQGPGKRAEGKGEVKGPSPPCKGCTHYRTCRHGGELRAFLEGILRRSKGLEGADLWPSFKRHLRFLQDAGFVDLRGHLTPEGRWASALRVEHPLLIAEAIRKGVLEGLDPDALAGAIAPFVWDREADVEVRMTGTLELALMEGVFSNIHKGIKQMLRNLARRGFEGPNLRFWPAAAVFLWAKGRPWEELFQTLPTNEGDMASLITRSADHLRQIGNLGETHPLLAATARAAATRILREPAYFD